MSLLGSTDKLKELLKLTAHELKRLRTEDLEGHTQDIHYFLIGESGCWVIDPERVKTLRACWGVLCRLPEEVAQKIISDDRVILIAPTRNCWGFARPLSFAIPEKRDVTIFRLGFVYLAPDLELQDDRVIVATVAHELAHIEIADIVGKRSEVAADALIRKWGFSSELDKLREANPNHRF